VNAGACIVLGMSTNKTSRTIWLVLLADGFKVPANTVFEAEAIKARFDARYPDTSATVRVVL
jgi:hypothetical protein